MIRFGLCCTFREQPIRFRTTTAKSLDGMSRERGLEKLAGLCRANAEALAAALDYCADNGIGCFRINSQIMPLRTHPQHGYSTLDLPEGDAIVRAFQTCGEFARQRDLRLAFPGETLQESPARYRIYRQAENAEILIGGIEEGTHDR